MRNEAHFAAKEGKAVEQEQISDRSSLKETADSPATPGRRGQSEQGISAIQKLIFRKHSEAIEEKTWDSWINSAMC